MIKAILVALGLLPVFHEDVGTPGKAEQLNAVAAAVAKATSDRDVAAFVLAWGDAESHYSIRVGEGLCRDWECDAKRSRDGSLTFRARSYWQLHRNGLSESDWGRMHGLANVEFQAKRAVKLARWAMNECRMKGDERILSGFRMLGAKGCHGVLPGERERLAVFKRVRTRL